MEYKRPSEHAMDIPQWLKDATADIHGTNRLGLAFHVYMAMLHAQDVKQTKCKLTTPQDHVDYEIKVPHDGPELRQAREWNHFNRVCGILGFSKGLGRSRRYTYIYSGNPDHYVDLPHDDWLNNVETVLRVYVAIGDD